MKIFSHVRNQTAIKQLKFQHLKNILQCVIMNCLRVFQSDSQLKLYNQKTESIRHRNPWIFHIKSSANQGLDSYMPVNNLPRTGG